MNRPPRVVVVGAGITGLTAAYRIQRERPDVELIVLERAQRVGGKILTTSFAGYPIDAAADAFLARVPEAVELCIELGLESALVTPATRRAHLYTAGRLQPFPDGLSLGVPTDLDALRASPVISAAGVDRAAVDLTMNEPPPDGDVSVGALVRARVGDEVYDTLVAPLLSGVYAGNADRLSAAVATPQFVAALREHGSLIAGLRAQLAAAEGNDTPVFFGLRHGTQSLPDRLASRMQAGGGVIRTGAAVASLGASGAGNTISVTLEGGDVIVADAVVIATPDFVTAELLRSHAPDVADDLASVPYASVTLVALEYRRSDVDHPMDGTGFLVPEREGLLLTACTWASSKWAHLADEDHCILRASVGRLTDARPDELDDDELVAAIQSDLATTMAIQPPPREVRVSRWPQALPQFTPGHLDRAERWRRRLAEELPGVVLAGAGIGGLGIPACIRGAGTAVVEVVESGRLGLATTSNGTRTDG
jgi:oxygen-dependent protoporphyrinogen oxidase